MKLLFTALPLAQTAAVFFVVGACVGNLLLRWMVRLTPGGGATIEDRESEPQAPTPDLRPPIPDTPWWTRLPLVGAVLAVGRVRYHGEPIGWQGLLLELGTGLIFAAFVVAMVEFRGQDLTPVVSPSDFWKYGRIFYHLALITFLIAAVGTDLRDYVIPDHITVPGILMGVLGATVSGELQMMHLWIDWNVEIPGLKGPGFPPWIDAHRHLHGLCWSLAGIAAGAGIAWIVRVLSRWILAQPAMGLGDVTLMAMMGSYIGWQAVLFVLALAPLCGILAGLGVRVFTGRRFVPFGPYLAVAALIVLFTWRWLWMLELPWAGGTISIRRLFGDWPSLAILGGAALATMVVLLGLIRLYRAIPVERRGA